MPKLQKLPTRHSVPKSVTKSALSVRLRTARSVRTAVIEGKSGKFKRKMQKKKQALFYLIFFISSLYYKKKVRTISTGRVLKMGRTGNTTQEPAINKIDDN